MKILETLKNNMVDNGWAEWVPGRGLQIDVGGVPDLPGVYVMVDVYGKIQKVGKSTTSLKDRMRVYRGSDKTLEGMLSRGRSDYCKSAMRHRIAIDELDAKGFFVYYIAAEEVLSDWAGIEERGYSFDATSREKSIKAAAILENHPMCFGPQ